MILFLVGSISSTLPGCAQPTVQEREYAAPYEFVLGPEDVLEISVWKNQDLTRTTAIRPDGKISMPIIGDVQAAGLTSHALAQSIHEQLKPFVVNPSVSITVKELNSYVIFVLGEVTKPGKFQLKAHTTLLQAISLAGGFTDYAKRNKMQVVRIKPNGEHKVHESRIPVRYDDLLSGDGGPGNFILLSGDTVVVP